jgi:uncharacterized membrane protein
MPTAESKPPRKARREKLAQTFHVHIKLFVSAALGIAVFFALRWRILQIEILQNEPRGVIHFLAAWNVAVLVYLALAAWVIARHEQSHLRALFSEEDEGAALILALTVAVAAASVFAIFAGLGAGNKANRLSPVLAMITVFLSWVFIHTIFAFHYAHEFYGEADGQQKGGLIFPPADRKKDVAPPAYWDFVYFSFVIGMTFQVSDVQITRTSLRRLVLFHGVVSFFYNVAVLALMVNIGGEYIKG